MTSFDTVLCFDLFGTLIAQVSPDHARDENKFLYRWIDGAAELIDELRLVPSIAVCLVSNSTLKEWGAIEEQLSVGRRFQMRHVLCEQGIAKPDPRCWVGLLERLGVPDIDPSLCWMIGDNQTDDLDPPARMGWNTFLAAKDGSNLALLRERLLNPA